MPKLVDKKTGQEIELGSIRTSFRGDKLKILNFTAPHKPGSTGKVYTRDIDNGWTQEYYPGVVGAKIAL
ncbi:MAG: hypothetical protein ACTSXE_02680 [Candidatus Thorarchaeota archaeon]